MRSRILLTVGLSIALCACARETPHLPAARLAPVLADLHIADAGSNMVRDTLHPNSEKNYDSLAIWTNLIFRKHRITMQEFNSSMDWYRDHPAQLDSLYAAVIPILEGVKK